MLCTLLAFCTIIVFGRGARIKSRGVVGQVGRATWTTDAAYACMQPWQRATHFSQGDAVKVVGINGQLARGGEFCLVDAMDAIGMASGVDAFSNLGLQLFNDFRRCESEESPHTMKVCTLRRVHTRCEAVTQLGFHTKVHMPKSCFRVATAPNSFPTLHAAVDEESCKAMMQNPIHIQGIFAPALVVATTTTTTSIEAVISDSACGDGFVKYWSLDDASLPSAFKCIPASCQILGTTGSGLSCRCVPGLVGTITWHGSSPQGECEGEITDLFDVNGRGTWAYNGMDIKCCVSDAGLPTRLQDLNAETLPSDGAMQGVYVNKRGCGYMFGSTYHNGLLPYKTRTFAECRVSMTDLESIMGGGFTDMFEMGTFHYSRSAPISFEVAKTALKWNTPPWHWGSDPIPAQDDLRTIPAEEVKEALGLPAIPMTAKCLGYECTDTMYMHSYEYLESPSFPVGYRGKLEMFADSANEEQTFINYHATYKSFRGAALSDELQGVLSDQLDYSITTAVGAHSGHEAMSQSNGRTRHHFATLLHVSFDECTEKAKWSASKRDPEKVGSKRFVSLEGFLQFDPVEQVCVAHSSTSTEYAYTYEVTGPVGLSAFGQKPLIPLGYKGTVRIIADSVDAEQVFVEYDATWEGDLHEDIRSWLEKKISSCADFSDGIPLF